MTQPNIIQRDDATESQVRSARPDMSTWLSANAGSGKTRVLTDRVARLLLAEVQPQHILCLTYTKAAASEMQNRLFKRLGEWAMKDDAALGAELLELGYEGAADAGTLRRARTLFARAIETPGGLKIQTIHSFCASLLRRFPLEAGVSPLFKEMEDRAATLLREDIVEDMADGDDTHLVQDLLRHFSGETLEQLTQEICRHRLAFASDVSPEGLADRLGVAPEMTAQDLQSQVFLGSERDLLTNLIAALETGGTNDQKAAAKLRFVTQFNLSDLPVLEGVFLTGAKAKEPFSAKIGSFPTKNLRESFAALMPEVEHFMMRIEDARNVRLALDAKRRAEALHRFAHRFLRHYETRKQAMGWLDFDDLIMRARGLLSDPAVAEWVLYRLDGGIDHILVDEAQDTSPVQWQVIERLAQEFTSGSGARGDIQRTIFVVGDKKQSIYSFQGADPAEFDRMRLEFSARLEDAETPLQSRELEYSFRSSEAVLRLVDLCFEGLPDVGFPQEMKHRAFHGDLPGRVDLWPVVEPSAKEEDGAWFDPVDRISHTHHTVILAQQIADEIKRMIHQGVTIADHKGADGVYTQRPVRAGDFLILVQRRSDLFHEIIRACKAADLPIAGADRLKVGAELAVRDLAALLSFLSTPEDDLSLAVALRSPLFGWSEQALYDLAHKRKTKYLWQALRERGEEFPDTMTVFTDLLGKTDFLRPYDLIERILTRHDGRNHLLARLGTEAEDGINALLSQALSYERSAVPSLTGFLVWLETDELEIKRQMDSAGDRIRVMTVHGSKGLEAPIVIMPDTGQRAVRIRDQIVKDDTGTAFWNVPVDAAPPLLVDVREAMIEAQKAERLRLLYVAMTRAEKWLIVAAAGELGKDGESWYHMVERAMTKAGATAHDYAMGQGQRYAHGDWSGPVLATQISETPSLPHLDPWFDSKAEKPPEPKKTLSPSDLGGAKALPGEPNLDEEAAKARGRCIHLLLEHLPTIPPADRQAAADTILRNSGENLNGFADQDLYTEVAAILNNEALQGIFTADGVNEVSLSTALGTERLHGTIDRLIVSDGVVLAVDFKSNAMVPDDPSAVPEGILRQMGAYAEALLQIYPDHDIQTAILWTKDAKLMPLPHKLVKEALANALIA